MTIAVKRARLAPRVGTATLMLATLGGIATMLPQMAVAQVAGGSQAGGGAPPQNTALSDIPVKPPEPRCIHQATDLRRNSSLDDDRLVVWLSVQQLTVASIKVSGSASGVNTGTFTVAAIRDGVPVATSREVRGSDILFATTSANVALVPGRQYKISAKATVSDKRIDLLDLYVGLGKACT